MKVYTEDKFVSVIILVFSIFAKKISKHRIQAFSVKVFFLVKLSGLCA